MPTSASCPTCHKLDSNHLKISLESLSKGAAEDCDVCSILSKGLSYFNDRLKDGDYLEFVIDSSLFVYVQDKDGKNLTVIEFYTRDEGKTITLSFTPNLVPQNHY